MTDAAGAYTIGNLPTGNYYAMSSQSQGYVDQFFGDVWCPGQCSFSNADSGAPIGVMAGADVGGRDFALRPGGSISGNHRRALAWQRHAGGKRHRLRLRPPR